MADFQPIPLQTAQHRDYRLSYCGGRERMARVAFYGVDADECLNAGLYFDEVAEFDSFEDAQRAIEIARVLTAGWWAMESALARFVKGKA